MLTKIHHIGVAVKEADAALRFYRDLLGLQITKDAVLEDQGIRGVLLKAGETEIELLQPLRPETPVGRFISSRGEGLHHLCFETDDIEAQLALARARNLQLIDDRPRPGLAGMIAFLHPKATRGVLVEYAQPPAATEVHDVTKVRGAGVRGFDHLAIAVSDLDDGVRCFRDNFDLVPGPRRSMPALDIDAFQLAIGEGYIGVVTGRTSNGAVAKFLNRRGEGLYLISLAVGDLQESVAHLNQAGVSVTQPVGLEDGTRLAFLAPRSTGGVLIQLLERAA